MKISTPKTWIDYIRLLKIVAVGTLVLIIMLEPPFLRELGIRSYETLWIIGVVMFLFIFTTAYRFFNQYTPSIQAFRFLRSIRDQAILFIPITHYSVHLRIMSNDLLYLFFASNLIYLSFNIRMVKWGGVIFGVMLIAIHLYSLFVSIRFHKLVGIYITPESLAYYEFSLEHIAWANIKLIKQGGEAFHFYEKDGELHELDFEDEEKNLAEFLYVLIPLIKEKGIPLEEVPEGNWIEEGFSPSLNDKKNT